MLMLSALLLAAAQGAPVEPVATSSDEDCAIFAEIARGELIRNDAGAIPLPEPRRSLKPVPSREARHAAYLEKLAGWEPANVDSYETWVLREGAHLEEFEDLPWMSMAELVTIDGEPKPAYAIDCDWAAHSLAFDPDEEQPNQWLVFTRPLITRDEDFALVHISYGYTNTHAREASCLLEKADGGWKFVGCRATLVS